MIRVTVMFRDRSIEMTECGDYREMLAVIKDLEGQGPWEICIEAPHAVG